MTHSTEHPMAHPAAPATDEAVAAEVLLPGEAAAHAAPWRDLGGRALEPNAFYGPELALAGLRHLAEGRGGRVVMAWRGVGPGRRLVGVLPFVGIGRRYGVPLPMRRAAAFYGTVSTPVIDPEAPEETLAAMLAALGRTGIHALLLPHLYARGPVAQALGALVSASGLGLLHVSGFERAFLDSPLGGAAYLTASLETRRRKEANRQRRRLADTGTLAFRVARGPEAVPPALDAFLALEAAGWKGRKGTDLRSAPGAAAFAREAMAALAESDAARVALLTLDGRPVAAGLVAVAGGRAFYMKTCYDESLARFSPGLLLTLDLTAHLLDDPGVADADSIAIADHPMIDRVWTGRVAVAAVLVQTRRDRALSFRALRLAETLREALRLRSRPLRDRARSIAVGLAGRLGKVKTT